MCCKSKLVAAVSGHKIDVQQGTTALALPAYIPFTL